MDRGLKGVPVEFVVHKLQTIGPELLASLGNVVPPSSIFPSINTAALPSELELHIRDRSQPLEAIPTHLLCVFNPHAGKASKGHLFPAHSLVLASQSWNYRLPVVPLPVPHPASFGFLNAYLYTRRIDKVLATLIPLPTQTLAGISAGMANQPVCGAIPQLSAAMARTFTMLALLDRAGVIHGMWSNARHSALMMNGCGKFSSLPGTLSSLPYQHLPERMLRPSRHETPVPPSASVISHTSRILSHLIRISHSSLIT
ncbi:hypothetical protein RhiXN_01445 [Rhizoctonia solani]|uniref:Uncharacterized protein n=1 Tax=Rhizoctonia solani TaxID=456999 RepID=A0A8H8P924_9AGAM|nr:uncharacterized protein RhiXN_01445 [Rhizoctonia solani]QRW26850.1 hypothetical protein RhiXN_01445 [Rhizoctonia solani]